jgi:nicotinate-nucleotide pyrophosphorylase (carboxylating)
MLWSERETRAARRLIEWALEEDLDAAGDVTTSALVTPSEQGAARVVARGAGVVAGLPAVPLVYEALGRGVSCTPLADDGGLVRPGAVVCELAGPLPALLSGERTMLNLLCHLSGIATQTRRFVEAAAGGRARIYDTRKTLPGWRCLQKYAVRAGGGHNHRQGLFDMVLIKDNHLAAFAARGHGAAAEAVRQARSRAAPGMLLEVEVDSLEQLRACLPERPDIVLLDNMSCAQLESAVALRDAVAPGVELEASGGVTLENIGQIAGTGVERISVGALTHSAPALDLGLDWKD